MINKAVLRFGEDREGVTARCRCPLAGSGGGETENPSTAKTQHRIRIDNILVTEEAAIVVVDVRRSEW